MNRKIFMTVAFGLSAISIGAFAHGPSKALHGGIVQTSNDLSFELVTGGAKSELYVVDHEKPADVSKMSGKLSILVGSKKTDVELLPAGENMLQAVAKIDAGARVVATVVTPSAGTGLPPVSRTVCLAHQALLKVNWAEEV